MLKLWRALSADVEVAVLFVFVLQGEKEEEEEACLAVFCILTVSISLISTDKRSFHHLSLLLFIAGDVYVCMCVCVYEIVHNRAIRPCHPNHSALLYSQWSSLPGGDDSSDFRYENL